ncbi:hypothetical protein ZWY2020_045348 [Hordeum vulgare]|nr:hypothetical protein ZWY2020_045348 [Hordeum vulgare]
MIAAAAVDFSGKKEQDHITDGGVADICVEYNGEQDEEGEDGSDSASDFENEMQDHMDSGTEEEMPDIMTAEDVQVGHQNDNLDEDLVQQVFVPNDNGVITAVINNPLKRRSYEACNLSQSSQVCNPS